MDEVAELQFGLAEDRVGGLGDEHAREGEKVAGGSVGDGVGQGTGLDFLFGGKFGGKHGPGTPHRVGWWISRRKGSSLLCVQKFH